MDPKKSTESIGGQIQPAAIRMSQYFDASIEDVVNELFQNARRAGATRVTVDVSDLAIRIEDDGKGIERPEVLLEFGVSGWSEDPGKSENPRGIGFFALARRRTRIVSTTASRTWEAKLTPDQFVGQAQSPVIESTVDGSPRGTCITVDLRVNENHLSTAMTVRRAARFYPVPVVMNDEELERSGFLDGSRWTHTWKHLEIGVKRGPAAGHCGINFNGNVVRTGKLPTITTLQDPDHQRKGEDWRAAVDVQQGAGLSLALSQRWDMLDSKEMTELAEVCKWAILSAIALTSPKSRLSYETWSLGRKHLKDYFPAPVQMLERWIAPRAGLDRTRPRLYEKLEDGGPAPLLMSSEIDPPDAQALQRALTAHQDVIGPLYEEDERLAGYAWYDNLARVVGIRFTYRKEGEGGYWLLKPRNTKTDHPRAERHRDHQAAARVRNIRIEIDVEAPDGTRRTRALEADLALRATCANQSSPQEDIEILLTNEAAIDKPTLKRMLKCAYFEKDYDDSEADPDGYREDEFDNGVESITLQILESREESTRRNDLGMLGATLVDKLNEGETLTVQRTAAGTCTVKVERTTDDKNVMQVQEDLYLESDDNADELPHVKRLGMRRLRAVSTRPISK